MTEGGLVFLTGPPHFTPAFSNVDAELGAVPPSRPPAVLGGWGLRLQDRLRVAGADFGALFSGLGVLVKHDGIMIGGGVEGAGRRGGGPRREGRG